MKFFDEHFEKTAPFAGGGYVVENGGIGFQLKCRDQKQLLQCLSRRAYLF